MTEIKKEPKNRNAGRKPKDDPAVFRYGIKLNSQEKGRFEILYQRLGLDNYSKFIKAKIFGTPLKVVHIDKSTKDFYMRLTNFYYQFQAVGNNYNQIARALKSNFNEQAALALLHRLEKKTIEMVFLNQQIIALTKEYEQKYLDK